MPATDELKPAVPGFGAPGGGGEPSLRRILVPVASAAGAAQALTVAAGVSGLAGGTLRLVHVRLYDPPARGCMGRFYPETVQEAAAVLDEAMLSVWTCGQRASAAVVDAPRPQVAAAIATAAAAWHADLIVLSRRPRLAISRLLWGCVPDQVMRKSGDPVLAVHPGPG